MIPYKLFFRAEFWDSIRFFDTDFVEFIDKRIQYLKKDPYQYSFITSYKLNLFTIKVTSIDYDIKIVFKIIDKNIFILFSYSMDLNLEEIKEIYKKLEE